MNTTTELITLTGLDGALISATDNARARRDELIALAQRGTSIVNAESANRAAAVLVELKTFSREIEAARVDAKAPVLDLTRKIDALARDLTASVEAEADRVSKLLGAYQAEQNRLAEEQRRKVWVEGERIRHAMELKERAAAEVERKAQAVRDAEAKRVQDELAAKAARATSQAGKQRALEAAEFERLRAVTSAADAERAAALAQQARTDEAAKALAASQAKIVTTAPKPEGVATRRTVRFEITDIVALYEAAPFLVKLEVNTAALTAALKGLRGDQTLPGVKHFWETSTIVR